MNVKVTIDFEDGATKADLEENGVTEKFFQTQYKEIFKAIFQEYIKDTECEVNVETNFDTEG